MEISSFASGSNVNLFTGKQLGSGNPTANFTMGILSSYSENNASPIADTAYQATAVFVADNWKATKRLTLELGLRLEHIGHWYDREPCRYGSLLSRSRVGRLQLRQVCSGILLACHRCGCSAEWSAKPLCLRRSTAGLFLRSARNRQHHGSRRMGRLPLRHPGQ